LSGLGLGEGGHILDAGLLEGIKDFYDNAKGRFTVGLHGDTALGMRFARRLDRGGELFEGDGFVIEGNLVAVFDAEDDRLSVRGWGGFSFLGFGEVDLNLRLFFSEGGRDDEKISRIARMSMRDTTLTKRLRRLRV
jgi:hypothetical protein